MRRFPQNDIISLVGEAPRYDLGESIGPDLHLGVVLKASGQASWSAMPLSYATAAGDPQLRQAIAEAHGVHADDVVVTVGGMHALFLIAWLLCDRGAEAVMTSPLFPPARTALEMVGAQVHLLPLSFEHGYQLDAVALSELLSPATTLVSLASPQNPSGVALPAHTLGDVLAAMEARCPGAYLLVDETYREAAYEDDPVARSAATLSPKVISVASLSKCHGAPGLRLGWAITQDPALREQLVIGKFNTVISCSPLCEALARSVFQQQDGILVERRRMLAEGRARTAAWVQAHQEWVEWVQPDAGAICCVRLKSSVVPDDRVRCFYDALVGQGVRVANGSWFGEEARVFRLGFGLLALPELQVALSRLSVALQQTVREIA